MTPPPATPPTDWVLQGHDSLREHLLALATLAHAKYAPITPANLDALLHDSACVRYPTRLVFEFGDMAAHQFAQPEWDRSDPQTKGRVLYLRPYLREHPDQTVLAVAYMLPALNYGEVVTDEHCRVYGATLLGMLEEEFYQRICQLADATGADVLLADPGPSPDPAPPPV
jgi:hypothetical protein